jgi:hypothetical protein
LFAQLLTVRFQDNWSETAAEMAGAMTQSPAGGSGEPALP